jgi:protein-S-isoprenylcysteine O-methyltransferase Ste14
MPAKPLPNDPRRRHKAAGPVPAIAVASLLTLGTVAWSLYQVASRSAPMAAQIRWPYVLAAGFGVLVAAALVTFGRRDAAEIGADIRHTLAGVAGLIAKLIGGRQGQR